jgi:hypothetical protein
MNKTFSFNKILLLLGLSLTLVMQSTNAFAWDKGRPPRRPREVIRIGHERYHYHHGRFYRPTWFGLSEVALVVPPIGAIVTHLPIGHRIIVFGGVKYYYYDNAYYTDCASGYIVVSPPIVTSNVATVPQETVTINVPNSTDSYIPVTLIRQKDGYIGPQGEYYMEGKERGR